MLRTVTAACLLSALLLCAVGCPKPTRAPLSDTGGVAGQPAQDELLAGLNSVHEEVRQFATVFITRFKLPGYEQPLRALANSEPVFAMALAVVYRDSQPVLEWYKAQADKRQAQLRILGAAAGLECTKDTPPELWAGLLDATAPADRPSLLWAMAELSGEPGGPLLLDDQTELKLAGEQAAEAINQREGQSGGMALADRAAYDALLGGSAEYNISWEEYSAATPKLPLSAVEWAALLRWAPPAVWQSLLADKPVDDQRLLDLAEAAVLSAPAAVRLPWGANRCAAAGASLHYRMLQAPSAERTTMLESTLAALKSRENQDVSAAAKTDLSGFAEAQGRALQLVHFAAVRGDAPLVAFALSLAPEMDPATLAAVVATLGRDNPELVTDAQLLELVQLTEPTVAYWLLLAWGGRQPVVDSRMPALVRVTPGQENVMLVYAYRLFHSQDKLSEDG